MQGDAEVLFTNNQKTAIQTELETVIDHVIDTSECPIRELAQERAFYSPSADEIILPIRSSFKDEVSFRKNAFPMR